MHEAVDTKFAKSPRPRPHLPSLVGTGWIERMRSTSFALLGLTAAAGLGMVAIVSQLGFHLLAPAPLPSAPEQGLSIAKAIPLGQGAGVVATAAIDAGRPAVAGDAPSAGRGGSGDRRQAALAQPTEVGSSPQQGAGAGPAAGESPAEETAPAPEPSTSPEPEPEPEPVEPAPGKSSAPGHAIASDLPGAVSESLGSPGKSRGSSGHGSGGKRSLPSLPPLPSPSSSSADAGLPDAVPDEGKSKGKGKKDK
jgi:hypothetical protein